MELNSGKFNSGLTTSSLSVNLLDKVISEKKENQINPKDV